MEFMRLIEQMELMEHLKLNDRINIQIKLNSTYIELLFNIKIFYLKENFIPQLFF
jgi:hypothetical protein